MTSKASRAVPCVFLSAALAVAQVFAPAGPLKFEVASIRPTQPGTPKGGLRPLPGGRRYVGSNNPLRYYLAVAYQVRLEQIEGGPGWIDSECYEINAEAERPSTLEELHIMMQNLLTERFHLQFHHEMKKMQAYVLSVEKGGLKNLKIREHAGAGDTGVSQTTEHVARAIWRGRCATLDMLAFQLAQNLDRPVLNQTGVTGCFDFELTFRWDLPVEDGQVVNGDVVDASAPRLYDALQNELGLRMEAMNAPVDVMVIDHAGRPTEN
jgi:uncharacterized protein (TIGR03435 family)